MLGQKSLRYNLREHVRLRYLLEEGKIPPEAKMAEAIMLELRDIAYLASKADSVEERRRLELLMEATATYIETRFEEKKKNA